MKRLFFIMILISGAAIIISSGKPDSNYKTNEIDPSVYDNLIIHDEVLICSDCPDVNQIGYHDRNLCWAAVASNMLKFDGWVDNEYETYDWFRNNYENKSGHVVDALIDFMPYNLIIAEYNFEDISNFIVYSLNQGNVVSITIVDLEIRHALTVYGYKKTDIGINIYYVDNNDKKRNKEPLSFKVSF